MHDKSSSINSNILQRLKALNADHGDSLDYVEKIKQQISYVEDRATLEPFDKDVWECFMDQRKHRSDSDILQNPEHHFRIQHLIDAVNATSKKHKDKEEKGSSRIGFIRTPKGNGKTGEQARLIRDLADRDSTAEVILLRNTESEVSFGLSEQLERDDGFPVYMKGNSNKLYHKHYRIQEKDKTSTTPRPMGFATYLRGSRLEAAQGGTGKSVKLIIGDECNFTGSSSSINEQDLRRFLIFCSSIIRFNPGVDIYMFGNNLPLKTGMDSDLIMDAMKLDLDINYKRIKLISKNQRNKMFLHYGNIPGGIYKGAEDQAFLGLYGERFHEDITSNKPSKRCEKIVSLSDFVLRSFPLFGYVFQYKESEWVLYCATMQIEKQQHIYVVRVTEYEHDCTYDFRCITDDNNIANKYQPRMLFATQEVIQSYLFDLYIGLDTRRVGYCGTGCDLILGQLMSKGKTKYKLDWVSGDFA